MLDGEAQVAGELLTVGEQALHRRGVAGDVRAGEHVDAGLHERDELRAGVELGGVLVVEAEQLPVGVLELGLCFGGDLRQNVPSPVDQALLAKRATEDLLAGAEPSSADEVAAVGGSCDANAL